MCRMLKASTLRLNDFFICTSIIIHVHTESKAKSLILGYGLVAELHIPEILIKPSSGISRKSSIQFILLINGLISLTEG